MRSGIEVQCAQKFLQEVSTEVCVLMAMMADASDDGLSFTRSVDGWDSFDPAALNSDVYYFLIRIVELYKEDKLVDTFSYTKYMLDSWKHQPVIVPLGQANFKTVGDRNGVPNTQSRIASNV